MQIDKEKLRQLLSLSEDDLKKKVTDAVNAVSFDKKDKEHIDKALKNMKDIKKTLGSIDEESIKKAMDALGGDKIEELKKNLKK
ncbi:MAG: hypothetical protein FWH10_00345 [Oscillospiraceae bacterium]|nr:hypothetical protein [Oscillospiraceae bacterium]